MLNYSALFDSVLESRGLRTFEETVSEMAPKDSLIVPKIVEALEQSMKPSMPWWYGPMAPVDLGLTIAGVGPVDLPLRPADVRKLSDVVRQAPYGKRTETIVDTSVRDTLEIDADLVTYSRELGAEIKKAVAQTAKHLQLDGDCLQVELYKLLIYTKGGFFLPHRDSEKRPGMVATMIVVLPSKFGGGRLQIQQGRFRFNFDADKARKQATAEYIAFFADCVHEVKPVTSGVRVCLAFNLILQTSEKSSRRLPETNADPKLLRAIGDWQRHRSAEPIVFALEHQYTEAGLRPELLKGADLELHRQVAAVCEATNCVLHFGQVSRHLCQFADDGSYGYGRRGYRGWSGNFDDLEIGEVYDDEIEIDGWKDANGKSVKLASLKCTALQLISSIPAQQWVPTQQDYEGYSGNAGNTIERWYHKSAIVIWPRSAHFEIIAKMSLEFAIDQLLAMRQQLPSLDEELELEQACENCRRLAEAIILHWPDRSYAYRRDDTDRYRYLQKFVQELPLLEEPELIAGFLQVVSQRDWLIKLDSFVFESLDRLGTECSLPLWQTLIECEPPPNRHGVRVLEGLAERDASWLLKLACDRNRGGLSHEQLHKLIASAAKKYADYLRREAGKQYRRDEPSTLTWLTLCKAAIVSESHSLDALLELATECESVIDLRKTQVAAAIELRSFAHQRLGQSPKPLITWIDGIREKLKAATQIEPTVPTDFTRPSETRCPCAYCQQLSTFLNSPTLEKTRIATSEAFREHLNRVIHDKQLDVKTELIRSGSPYSLQCSKTTDSYQRQLKQYQADLGLLASLETA